MKQKKNLRIKIWHDKFFSLFQWRQKNVSHCQIKSNHIFARKIRLKISINEIHNTFFYLLSIGLTEIFEVKIDPFFISQLIASSYINVKQRKRHKSELLIFTPLSRWETYIFHCHSALSLRFPFCVRVLFFQFYCWKKERTKKPTHTPSEWVSLSDQKRKRKLCQMK